MSQLKTFHRLDLQERIFRPFWLEESEKLYVENHRMIQKGDEIFLVLINEEERYESQQLRTTVKEVKALPCVEFEKGLWELTLEATAYLTGEGIFVRDDEGMLVEI